MLLVPTNFMQCDEIFGAELRAGDFAIPLSRTGVNRVDLRDVGEVAAAALTDPGFPAGSYPVAGPASLSGAECARVWAAELGRPVRYTGDDPAAFAAAAARHLDGRKLRDWLGSFAYLRRHGVPTSARQVAITTRLLGRAPTGYPEYVARTAAGWRRGGDRPDVVTGPATAVAGGH